MDGKVNEVGQSFVIKLVEPYKCLTQINGYQDETTGEDTSNYFCKWFRWSTDNVNFSELIELTDINLQNITLNPNNDFWIEYKYEACELETAHELEFISIALEAETESGVIEQVVQTVCCEDVWANTGLPNLTICDDECGDNLFNPYALGPANNMYLQMSNLVNDIFGHCVKYYKVDPDLRTEDTVLNEYTLHSVTAVKEIKVLVPENDFPSEEIHFNDDGMGFDGFEIHITYKVFHEAFGAKTSPKYRDYVYVPRIDKMFQVNSVALEDEFNNQYTYWRVKLVKWEDRDNVDWDETLSAEKEELQDLVVSVDEVFVDKKQDEYDKITKPQQFKTIGTEDNDYVRSALNVDLLITDYNLNNNWTIVSKHYYDLTKVAQNTLAVKYRLMNQITETDNRAFTFWFKWVPQSSEDPKSNNKTITSISSGPDSAALITCQQKHRYSVNDTVYLTGTGVYDGLKKVKSIVDYYSYTIDEDYDTSATSFNAHSLFKEVATPVYGYNFSGGSNGIYFKLMDGYGIVKINSTQYLFDFSTELPNFNTDRWYACVISLNNQFGQLGFYLYELYKPLQNSLPQVQNTVLDKKFSSVMSLPSPVAVDSQDKWMLLGGPVYFTNFRIFDTSIEEEKHSAVLNQYVVRDAQLALLVDNAQPQLRVMRLTNPR